MSTLDLKNLRNHHLDKAEKAMNQARGLGLGSQYFATICDLSAAKHMKEAKKIDNLLQKEIYNANL
jgi:hypothetical protein